MYKILIMILVHSLHFNVRANQRSGDIGDILNFMESYDIEITEDIDQKYFNLDATKLPKELSYLKGHLEFTRYGIEEFNKDTAIERAKLIFSGEYLDLETYEFLYQGVQEICGWYMSDEEPEKCENLESWFQGVNDELQILLETGYVPGGKIEDLAGEQVTSYLDGTAYVEMELPKDNEDGTVYSHDKRNLSYEIRNSIRLKNAHLVKDQKDKSVDEIRLILCHFEFVDQFKTEEEMMLKLSKVLEGELLRGDTSFEDKEEIYCTLYSYYERINDNDRLFSLIPNSPERIDLSCSKFLENTN